LSSARTASTDINRRMPDKSAKYRAKQHGPAAPALAAATLIASL
jgi:hypothetical protein